MDEQDHYISTGISGLDEVLAGGLLPGRRILTGVPQFAASAAGGHGD
jgi:KaiC/GvpD/RAD55 family RecA-like ATPase